MDEDLLNGYFGEDNVRINECLFFIFFRFSFVNLLKIIRKVTFNRYRF